MRSFKRLAWSVLFATLWSAAQAQAPSQAHLHLDIPALRMADALNEFARQSGLQVLIDWQDSNGLTSPKISGSFTAQEALTRLLRDSGLHYQYLDARTIAIRAATAPPRSSLDPPASFLQTAGDNRTIDLAQTETGQTSQGTGQPAQTPLSSKDDSFKSFQLEEVIVTAQKRKEILRDVPESVTVLRGDTLERLQAVNLEEYAALIPGLQFQSQQRGQARLTLRGISTGGLASSVASYLDDVPIGTSSGVTGGAFLSPDFDTLDIERIEVLRGPQGTLYGANSLGGLLKIVTKEPLIGQFDATASVLGESVSGGAPDYAGTGTVNIPLGDRFALRASGFYRRDGGFIDSTGTDPIFDVTGSTVLERSRDHRNINEVRVYGGRVSALFKATDDLSLRLTALLQNVEAAGGNFVEADPTTLHLLYGGFTFPEYLPQPLNSQYRVYSATVDWDLDFAHFTSSSSYASTQSHAVQSLDSQLAPLVTALFGDPITRPLSLVSPGDQGTDKVTQELRLSSPSNTRFEWLFGLFYTHEKSASGPASGYAFDLNAQTIATDLPVLVEQNLRSTYQEYAGFANATWHATPRIDLSFGGRFSRNQQEADQNVGGLLEDIFGQTQAINNLHSAENVFTYSVAPAFKLNDTATVYARLATGYRPGGPNIIPPNSPPGTPFTYKSDRTTNYEVGLKADWFQHALSLDLATYYINWRDIQTYAVINQTGVNDNGGTAVSKGVEFSVAARPIRGLTFALDGAYSDAHLTQDASAATMGYNGDPLPYVPDWSANLNSDYEWSLPDHLRPYVGSSVRYIGHETSDFGVRTPVGDPTGSLFRIPAYAVVDLRAGLRTDRWSLEAYARNVGNKQAITSAFVPSNFASGAAAVTILHPRTIGLSVGFHY